MHHCQITCMRIKRYISTGGPRVSVCEVAMIKGTLTLCQ